MKTPRPYQREIVAQTRSRIREGHKNILIVAPTGCGKMFIAAWIMSLATEMGNRIIFIADGRELIFQCHRELQDFGVDAGTIMAGTRRSYAAGVKTDLEFDEESRWMNALAQVVSKDTLRSRIKRKKMYAPPADIVIVDEAHRCMAKEWQKIITEYEIQGARIIGMTATPCRNDGRGLGDTFSAMVNVATYKELQDFGSLVPTRIFAPANPDLKGVRISQGDYAKGQLQEKMNTNTLVGDIFEDWDKRASDRSTVIYASGIAHSIHIRDTFLARGVTCEHVDGRTPNDEREEILSRVMEGETRVICNYGVLTTGVDIPRLKCAVIARPTRSFGLWRQMGGRIQRPWGGYEDALILDHSASWKDHGFPDDDVDWVLESSENIKDVVEAKKKERERDGLEPRECPHCSALFTGPVCLECGFRYQRKPRKVDMDEGELREVKKAKAQKKINLKESRQQKEDFWNRSMYRARGMGRKIKSAAGMYKDRYGVWPRGFSSIPRGSEEWNTSARAWLDKLKEGR